MAEREITLLKEQIKKLEDKKFDLEAWKNHTVIFLERIFGKDSSKIKMIKELSYDYSSWSLRDTAASGKTKDKDPIRLQAGEILNAAIIELESLGLPSSKPEKERIWELLQDDLTGRQLRAIEELLKSEDGDKAENITEILESLGNEKLAAIIFKLLTT